MVTKDKDSVIPVEKIKRAILHNRKSIRLKEYDYSKQALILLRFAQIIENVYSVILSATKWN